MFQIVLFGVKLIKNLFAFVLAPVLLINLLVGFIKPPSASADAGYSQEQVDEAVAHALANVPAGFTQEQVDEAVAAAVAAVPQVGFSQPEVDAITASAVAEAMNGMFSQAKVDEIVAAAVAAAQAASPGAQACVTMDQFNLQEIAVGAAAITGLEDPVASQMVVEVPPHVGLYITMDAGTVMLGTQQLALVDQGAVLGFYNSEAITQTVTIQTASWNTENAKWNVWGSLRAGQRDDFFKYVFAQQYTVPGLDKGEMKPIFLLLELSGTAIVQHDPNSFNPYIP